VDLNLNFTAALRKVRTLPADSLKSKKNSVKHEQKLFFNLIQFASEIKRAKMASGVEGRLLVALRIVVHISSQKYQQIC
jgi:hypothetical protein